MRSGQQALVDDRLAQRTRSTEHRRLYFVLSEDFANASYERIDRIPDFFLPLNVED